MDKLVSVIVPAFNREKTIKRCLESILGQPYRGLELIVIGLALFVIPMSEKIPG